MIKKITIALLALMIVFPSPAQADKEFVQKIQNMISKIQEKAKEYQEKVNEYKTKIMQAKERAENFKNQAMGAVTGALGDLKAMQGGDFSAAKKLGTRLEGIPDPMKAANKEEVADAIGEKYNPPIEEGNDDEQYERIEQLKTEMMQFAVSSLYAEGHSAKAKLMEEPAPQKTDSSDTTASLREINIMALNIVGRMADIYLMESMLQTYQYTQNMKDIKRDVVKSEEEQE